MESVPRARGWGGVGGAAVRGRRGCPVQKHRGAAALEVYAFPAPVQRPQDLPMGHVRRVNQGSHSQEAMR
jgi:hypothetical protein